MSRVINKPRISCIRRSYCTSSSTVLLVVMCALLCMLLVLLVVLWCASMCTGSNKYHAASLLTTVIPIKLRRAASWFLQAQARCQVTFIVKVCKGMQGGMKPLLFRGMVVLLNLYTCTNGSTLRRSEIPNTSAMPSEDRQWPMSGVWCWYRSSTI